METEAQTTKKGMNTDQAMAIIEKFMFKLFNRISNRGYETGRHQDIQFAATLSRVLNAQSKYGWSYGDKPSKAAGDEAGAIRLPIVSEVGHRKTVDERWGVTNVETDGECWVPVNGELACSTTTDFTVGEIQNLAIALHFVANSHQDQ